jgi:hypothetical protein
LTGGQIRRIETASRELEHGDNLLSRNIEPFHDLVDGGSGFEVFEHGGHRHPRILVTTEIEAQSRPVRSAQSGTWLNSAAVIHAAGLGSKRSYGRNANRAPRGNPTCQQRN